MQVSPQFRLLLSPQKQKRQTRAQGGSSLHSRTGQLLGKENSSTLPPKHGRKTTQKFATLKFVENSPTVSCEKSDDEGNGLQTKILHTPLRRTITRNRPNGMTSLDNRMNGPEVGDCSIEPTQLHPTNSADTRCCKILSSVSEETGHAIDRSSVHVANSNKYNSPLCKTQQRPNTHRTRQSTRRLFSTETPPQTHVMQPSKHATSLQKSMNDIADEDMSEEPNCDGSVNTPVLSRKGSCGPLEDRTCRAARAWWWLLTDTPHKDMSLCQQPTVLVADTPVEDYSLPVRFRNLKYSRRLRRTNTSRPHPT